MTVNEKESTKKRKENYIEVKKPKVEYKENFKVSTKCQAFYNYGKVQFTGDGESILSICDGHLKCFQLSSGNTSDAVERFDGEEIVSFLLANDNNTLITAARNGIMRHWNLSTKSLEKTWKSVHVGIVTCMVFDETVTLLATGGSDSTIKVWDIIQRYHTHNLKGGKGVFSKICFLPMGANLHVFGAADDYNIHVWNLHRNEHIASLTGHYSTVTDFVFIQQNKQMLSCARDKVVLVWDLATFKLLKTIPIFEAIEACIQVPEQFSVPNLTLNDKDTYFMTAGEKGILKVWSTSSACCVYQHAIVPQESKQDVPLILDVVHVPSLNAIGITTYEQNILLHSSKDLSLINQFVGCNDDILSIKWVGADEGHIAVATNSPLIKVFQLPSFSCRLLKGHHDIVICLDVFPRHKNILVSGSKDNNVRVWDLGTDLSSIKCLYTGYGHTSSITDVCCCRGKSRFFASASEDMTLKLWEVPEGEKSSSDAAVKPLISPYITVKAHDKLINSLDISLNDKLIASGSQDHTAKIWDASDLSLRGVMRGHKRGVWCVKFSPVDLALATSSSDGTIRIWSLVDFSSLKVFQGHEASVLQVEFLSSGTQLISSGGDGNIHLWDIKDSMCIRTLAEHDHKVWTLAVSASEQQVISGGADSNIIVWNDVTQTEKQAKFLNREQFIVQEQELSNLVHEGKWIKALGLALTLNKPFASFEIIQQIRHKHDEATFVGILHEMRQDQKEILLKFSLEWLTNSKTYYPAVIIFDYFYKNYDSEELLKIPDMTTYIQEALPYLDRHSKRIERLSQDMQILNFLEKQMAPE